jgi:hypothetical protein
MSRPRILILIDALFSSRLSRYNSDCEDALSRGDDAAVQEMASEIRTFSYVPMRSQTAANICVSEAMGREMAFQLGLRQFIPLEEYEEIRSQGAEAQSAREAIEEATAKAVHARICELQEVLAETNQTLQQAEAARQDRRIDTLAATIQECNSWFNSDPRSALTNDICNSIFISGGLPNSEVSGPSTSEILLAELIYSNASAEQAFLIRSGRLWATRHVTEISEDGDPYDCDE